MDKQDNLQACARAALARANALSAYVEGRGRPSNEAFEKTFLDNYEKLDLEKVKSGDSEDAVIVGAYEKNSAQKHQMKKIQDVDFFSAFSKVAKVAESNIAVCVIFRPDGEKLLGPLGPLVKEKKSAVAVMDKTKKPSLKRDSRRKSKTKKKNTTVKSGKTEARTETGFSLDEEIDWHKRNEMLSQQSWDDLTKPQKDTNLLRHLGRSYGVPTFMVPIYGEPNKDSETNCQDVKRAVFCVRADKKGNPEKKGFLLDTTLKFPKSVTNLSQFEAFCGRAHSKKPKLSLKIDAPGAPNMNGKPLLHWMNQVKRYGVKRYL